MSYDLSRKKCLIVDDFYQFRRSLRGMMEKLECGTVHEAANARDALESARERHYDIFLVDYNLGEGMDGQELHDELVHEKLIRPSTIFIMVTAEDAAPNVLASLLYEPDDYLTKPFGLPVLQQRLEKALTRKHALEPIYRAIEAGRLEAGLKIADSILQQHPRYAMYVLRLQGRMLMDLGRYEEAIRLFRSILKKRELAWAWLGLGQCYFYLRDYTRAQRALEKAIAVQNRFLAARDWLAKVLMEAGDMKAAQEVLEEAVQLSPKSVERLDALGDVAEENGDQEWRLRARRLAVKHAQNTRHHNANRYVLYARALLDDMDGSGGLTDRRRAEELRKQIKGLRKNFRDKLEALIRGRLCTADLLEKEGKEKEAVAEREGALEEAEQLQGVQDPDTLLELADAHTKAGNPEKAEACLKELAEKHQDNPRVRSQLARREQDRKAAEIYDMAAEFNSEGVRLYRQKQWMDALKAFRKAVKLAPANASYVLNAAQSCFELAENERDAEPLQEAWSLMESIADLPVDDYRYERYGKLRAQILKLGEELNAGLETDDA